MVITPLGLFLLAFISFTNLLVGLVVYLRNTRLEINRLFLALAVGLTFWSSMNLISDNTTSFALSKATSSLAFSAGFIVLVVMSFFAYALRKPKALKPKHYTLFGGLAVVIAILYATPLVYELTTLDDYINGILYIPYLLSMITLLVFVSVNFTLRIRHGNPVEKNQTRIIMFGSTMMTITAITSNIVLPIFITASWTTKIGPFFTLFFIGSMSYAIAKHKLFDLRAVIARSLTYFAVTTVILVSYVIVAFSVQRLILNDSSVDIRQLLANVLLTVILIFLYQPLRKLFDKLTNRLFHRDNYDSQKFLNAVNDLLVGSIATKQVYESVVKTIVGTFKLRKAYIYVKNEEIFESHILSSTADEVPNKILLLSEAVGSTTTENIIIIDELADGLAIKELARSASIYAISKLMTGNVLLGILLLGEKESGSILTPADERTLAIVSDQLALALESSERFEEIQKFNITLKDEIDDATKQLRKTNEKLKALDEAKDEFISMASHQLRTPLTSVKGYLSMLAEGDAGELNEPQHKFVDQAFVSSQRMVYLISDLLNVSRLKTGKFVIEPTPVYLPDVVESEIAQLYETVKSRGLTMVYDKPKEFPTLSLDETKLRQVIMNFTDNAIYYTPTGGTINLDLKVVNGGVEFTVTDNGLGVPKNEQHNLFTKFYRAGNARKARPDGTGLGLFMAKKVIVASGGSLIFKSTEGKGSTFGFRFTLNTATKPENASK